MKMTKRLLSLILVLAMVVAYVPPMATQVEAVTGNTTEFAGGAGTAEDPYLISTKEHLNNVRNYLSAHFKMINDIEFTDADFAEGGAFYNSGAGWKPIGTFDGVFDGNGYAIHGIQINEINTNYVYTSGDFIGLFVTVSGMVCNLHMVDVDILVNIEDYYSDSHYCGAIAGKVSDGTIEKCSVSGTIIGKGDVVAGGLAGEITGSTGSVNACHNNANVSSEFRAGGLAGEQGGNSKIANCYNTGTIYGPKSNTGGIVGCSGEGTIWTSYNVGNVRFSATDSSMGYAICEDKGTWDCYYLSGSGYGNNQATVLNDTQMQSQSAFDGFNFENVWTMAGNPEYPYPELQSLPCSSFGNTQEFAGGFGIAGAPYLISNKEHLNNVRNYLSAHFKMINDIEFTEADFAEGGAFHNNGQGWIPISKFQGIFDGSNYTIRNLKISRTSDKVGLFGEVYNADIRNIRLVNASITGRNYVGGICGYLSTGGSSSSNPVKGISGCYVDGKIQAQEYAGGISGYMYGVDYWQGISSNYAYANTQIKNCYNKAIVIANNYAGGITASTYSAGCKIVQCINEGSVSSDGNAGGILGYLTGDDSNTWSQGGMGTTHQTYYYYSYDYSSVTDCLNKGSVSGKCAGGIVGKAYSPTRNYNSGIEGGCSYSYNVGEITGETTSPIIAIQGRSVTTACFDAYDDLTNIATFMGWNFETIWTMGGDPEYVYPELQCFMLKGKAAIEGNTAYKQTVFANISDLTRQPLLCTYTWYVNGVEVYSGAEYTVQASDVGKKLAVKVTSSDILCLGTVISEEYVVEKAYQSAAPAIPELLYLDDNKFEISTVSTQEYSIDNVNWQRNCVFENLDPNKTYTVYSRILENDLYLLGESVSVLQVGTDRRPLSGKVSITGTARYGDTLTADVSGLLPAGATFTYEWRSGGTVVGTGKTYTITQSDIGKSIVLYVKGTGDYIGTISSPAIVATKATVQLPNAPVVADKTNTSVTLVARTGYEYSMDKVRWQDSPVFTELSAATEYTFYQRVKETDTTFASTASNGTKETTLKNTVAAPAKPVVEKITNTSVTLKAMDGYEYSMDGLKWQTSNVFTGLKPYTEYSFCQRIAENKTDYASAQSGYTIIITLKNTVEAPAAPTIQKATATSVTLNDIAGYEYSIDGKTWQTNNVFTGLTTLQTYTFYQRIKETNTDYTSAVSAGTSFKVKNVTSAPAAPTLTEKTNNKIVVAVKTGYEYSINKTTWNTTGVFTGLQPNKTYTVYCRIPETDTHYASGVSSALTVTTMKNTVAKPGAPTISSKTSTSVTLVSVAGAEYSKDGTIWQTSNVFTGLSPNKTYTFYQRVAETSTAYASEKSAALTVTTSKNTVSAPSAPTLSAKTSNSVTLVKTSGYEYSKDGLTWQTSNVFENLSPNTTYVFYQRLAETSIAYASEKSAGLTVTTPKNTVAAPTKPVAVKVTQTSVTLAAYAGYEYSMDGQTWQNSNVFTGLSLEKTYTFYQRVAATSTSYASEKSAALTVTTLPKADCLNKAEKPILVNASNNSITLLNIEGYEYKIDNGAWQPTPVFDYLKWGESYTLYQRIKETSTHKASATSMGLVVNLDMKPSVSFCQSMLSDYIDIYGTTQSNGNKKVTKLVSSTYIYLENTSKGIYCSLTSGSSSGTSIKYYFGFYLTPTSKYIEPTMLAEGYYNGRLISTATLKASVDRTTYTNASNIQIDGYADGSNFQVLYNNHMKLLCTAMHIFLLEDIGSGIGGVGFLAFSGENDDEFYCDAALNHQCGNKVLKYGYAATCERQGYTGDYCCSYCGEIIEKGKTISALGGHKYSNSCDIECNECGFKRDADHTYGGNCDEKCNVCGFERVAIAEHTFNGAHNCQLCGAAAEYSVVFKNWNGNVISSKTYHYGDKVSVPSNPTRPDEGEYMFVFAGWDQEVTTCNGNDVYIATYTKTAIAMVSIAVTTKPNKVVYVQGESLSTSGMVVSAIYNNNTSKAVTGYTVSGYDATTIGQQTITISYNGKTTTFTVTVKSPVPSAVTSSVYAINGSNISKISLGTTVTKLMEGINEKQYVKVFKGNTEVNGNTLVGTGMVVKIMDGNTVMATYTIVVTGDTNGDGKLTVTDFVQMQAHLLNKTPLQGAAAKAADTSGDGKISVTDYVQMQAHILGKSSVQPRSV